MQFPKAVESAARHDKLKRIGHPLPRFGTDCFATALSRSYETSQPHRLHLPATRDTESRNAKRQIHKTQDRTLHPEQRTKHTIERRNINIVFT